MDSKQALRPGIFNIEAFKKDEEALKRGATEEERFLYGLTSMKGWQLLKEFKERVIAELYDANKVAMSSGLPFEEIGKNAVVINLAEDIVNKIINLVEDAKEACEADLNDKWRTQRRH